MKKFLLLSFIMIFLAWLPKITSAQSLEITNLTVASGESYEIVYDGLQVGELAYTDRSYTFATIPDSVLGMTFIRPANDDQADIGDSFLSFDVNQTVNIYVCFDNRNPIPDWLLAFTDTGKDLDTTGCADIMSIFQKEYLAGNVVLGGNANAGTGGCMYIVLVKPTGTLPSSVDLTAKWQQVLPTPENDLEGWVLWYSGDQFDWVQIGTIPFETEQAEYSYQFEFPQTEGVWYFRMRAYDEVPNFSDWSNIASIDLGVVPDTEPPVSPDSLIIEKIQ